MLAHLSIGLLALFPTNPATLTAPLAHAAQIQETPYSTTTVAAYAKLVDDMNGFRGRMYHTLELESDEWKNGQSQVPSDKGPNGLEDSWGVCQIHLPSHKEITREQALDWQWCIDWAADMFKAGEAYQWTEYRILYLNKQRVPRESGVP